MEYLITFVTCFIVIYLIYFFVIINRKKGLESFKKGKQLDFFKTVYKLDFRKIDIKKFAHSLSLTNAFIMSTTITIIDLIDNFALKMILGIIILIPLMLIMYKFLGEYYKKKEGQ